MCNSKSVDGLSVNSYRANDHGREDARWLLGGRFPGDTYEDRKRLT
jgi:hypothetical protein